MGGPEWRRRRKQRRCFSYPIRPIAQVGTNEQAATAYTQARAQDASGVIIQDEGRAQARGQRHEDNVIVVVGDNVHSI